MGEQINIVSGVGAGEGPAAARGHQSGEEGAAVAKMSCKIPPRAASTH